jgi:RNA polymerase sigma-70 factor (ECF subfamily)
MENCYKQYGFGLRKYISQKIDDEGVVEELVSDVMLAAINSEKNFEGRCSQFSWLCSIANHKVIDYYRKKKIKTVLFSVSPVFEEIADKALNPERDVLKNELKEEIKKTFGDMRKGYQKLLRLKYVEGWKVKEIAKKMNITIKAVESRLVRAKKEFRENWAYDKKKD